MISFPVQYREVLKRKDFLLLIAVMFLFQASTSFVLLGLVVSVFLKTGSNFGVSGIIVSFSIPGFLLFALAGLTADLIDRKKLIVSTNVMEVLLIFFILLNIERVFASIVFSFLYFAANAFFLPAASAAVSQLVRKSQLLVANSVFTFTIVGGQIAGFIVAAIVHFFFGSAWTLLVCEAITVLAVWIATLLPPLRPSVRGEVSVIRAMFEIWGVFRRIFARKLIWFYFVLFASMQGLVAVGVTLGPGFFDEVLEIPINRSPIFVLPMITLGVILGALFANQDRIVESKFVISGMGAIGFFSIILGIILKWGLVWGRYVLIPVSLFLTALGFGVMAILIASRAILQKKIAQRGQGTVFGAQIVLMSFFAGVMSPVAAGLEALFGYINILIFGGAAFGVFAVLLVLAGKRWKF